jgi:hypothetical protein
VFIEPGRYITLHFALVHELTARLVCICKESQANGMLLTHSGRQPAAWHLFEPSASKFVDNYRGRAAEHRGGSKNASIVAPSVFWSWELLMCPLSNSVIIPQAISSLNRPWLKQTFIIHLHFPIAHSQCHRRSSRLLTPLRSRVQSQSLWVCT